MKKLFFLCTFALGAIILLSGCGIKNDTSNLYTNNVYKYQLDLPSGTNISEAVQSEFTPAVSTKLTAKKAFEKYTGKICTKIEYKGGVIYVSAPNNGARGADYVFCTTYPTGVGTDTKIVTRNENININGKTYDMQITDMNTDGMESFSIGEVTMDDGTFITFRAKPNLAEDFKTIIASFRKTK